MRTTLPAAGHVRFQQVDGHACVATKTLPTPASTPLTRVRTALDPGRRGSGEPTGGEAAVLLSTGSEIPSSRSAPPWRRLLQMKSARTTAREGGSPAPARNRHLWQPAAVSVSPLELAVPPSPDDWGPASFLLTATITHAPPVKRGQAQWSGMITWAPKLRCGKRDTSAFPGALAEAGKTADW